MSFTRIVTIVGIAALSSASAWPQAGAAPGQPRFVNARVETRAGAAGLEKALGDVVASRGAASWVGYTVAAVPGRRGGCDMDRYPSRVYLEGLPAGHEPEDRQRVALEASREMAILVRVEAGTVQKVRSFSTDCEIDAGGLPVIWLTGVSGAESVSLLRGWVTREADLKGEPALAALAMHKDPSAQQALEAFVAAGQPARLRKRAAFWLGAARGDAGFDVLRRLVTSPDEAGWRRDLVFPVSLARRPEATDLLIRLARHDASAEVRKQAMFWLARKAGGTIVSTLGQAAVDDPDTAVKKQAVFGLSRMPNGQGVPTLIEIARTNRNPEVRRQAMFWLGRSEDPRALDYLEEVVRK